MLCVHVANGWNHIVRRSYEYDINSNKERIQQALAKQFAEKVEAVKSDPLGVISFYYC